MAVCVLRVQRKVLPLEGERLPHDMIVEQENSFPQDHFIGASPGMDLLKKVVLPIYKQTQIERH